MGDERVNTEFLGQVALFRQLDVNQLAEILILGAVKEYNKDAVIFEDGSPGDSESYLEFRLEAIEGHCRETIAFAQIPDDDSIPHAV